MDSHKIILLAGALIVAAITAFFARTLMMGSATPQAVAGPAQTTVVVDGPALFLQGTILVLAIVAVLTLADRTVDSGGPFDRLLVTKC